MNNAFETGIERYFTAKQLQYIQSVNIGIAGAGGLGSNIAFCLVRSGFRRLDILDFDRVEASNLNRQQYFLHQIGMPKVQALSENLRAINPDLELTLHQDRLTPHNSSQFFSKCHFLFEAFDQISSKKMILEQYGNTDKTIISGIGMAGFLNETPIQITKMHHRLYVVGDRATSIGENTPPLAPRVMACAALMASVVLEICYTQTLL